jgi:precorrin-3B synthase
VSLAAIEIKGWCPGALRPMPSGDGLIARLRPWCGAFSLDQARGIAEIAATLGNGHIDLTRRANLQIRGLAESGLSELHAALDKIGLLDPDPETEAARNIMVSPLAGLDPAELLDVRPMARELASAVAADRRFGALPAKFGWLVDGGGAVSIAGERADVALCAVPGGMALRLDGQWMGIASPDTAVAVALAAGRRESVLSLLQPATLPPPRSRHALAPGVAAPFGRVEAEQLLAFVALAEEAGASDIRLSPWRILYVDPPAGPALRDGASRLGFIVDPHDPLLRVEACPGAPACASSTVDTRRDARRIASQGFTGSLHVSGCAKGCARSAPSDLVLIGENGRYGVVRNGTARDTPERTIASSELLDA